MSSWLRLVLSASIVCMCAPSSAADESPLATIEALHAALRIADRSTADSILHEAYRDGQRWKVVSFADSDNALNGKPIRAVCPD